MLGSNTPKFRMLIPAIEGVTSEQALTKTPIAKDDAGNQILFRVYLYLLISLRNPFYNIFEQNIHIKIRTLYFLLC